MEGGTYFTGYQMQKWEHGHVVKIGLARPVGRLYDVRWIRLHSNNRQLADLAQDNILHRDSTEHLVSVKLEELQRPTSAPGSFLFGRSEYSPYLHPFTPFEDSGNYSAMSRRQSTEESSHRRGGQMTQSDPHPQSSALGRGATNTGRARGSSSNTPGPSVSSPTPSRGYQAQLDRLQKMSLSQERTQNETMTPPENRGGPSRLTNIHDRQFSNMSSTTLNSVPESPAFSDGSGSVVTAFRFPQPQGGIQGGESSQANAPGWFTEGSRNFRSTIDVVLDKIQKSKDMPPTTQNMFLNEVYKIGQDFDEYHRHIRQEHDRVVNERDNLYGQINETNRKYRTVVEDRDRYWNERDELKRQLNERDLKAKQSIDKIQGAEQNLRLRNAELEKRIAFQEEQLKGKRALWMDSHPESSARRAAMSARDPFTSPSVSQRASFDNNGGGLSSMLSPTQPSPYTGGSFGTQSIAGGPPADAPRGPKRRGQLPTGRALPAREMPTSSWHLGSQRIFNTEAGSPPPSMALVVRSENLAPEYQADIGKIYALVEGWVKTYANIPNLSNDQQIARSNDVLWAYMMNCTYPGQRQDSHSHVVTLLNDENSRYWFVMRMIVTYICKDILVIDIFAKFDNQAQTTIAEVMARLNERGLANDARQALVDQQAAVVSRIIDSPDYNNFRADQITYHSKRLRDMLGPLLNEGGSRATAGHDLGAIVVKSWETAVRIFTSHLSFQIHFPETAQKFTAATMIAKDQPKANAMQLQLRQTRLKLVITPVVTMRDDRGTTIKAKNLHLSTVLTMG